MLHSTLLHLNGDRRQARVQTIYMFCVVTYSSIYVSTFQQLSVSETNYYVCVNCIFFCIASMATHGKTMLKQWSDICMLYVIAIAQFMS